MLKHICLITYIMSGLKSDIVLITKCKKFPSPLDVNQVTNLNDLSNTLLI